MTWTGEEMMILGTGNGDLQLLDNSCKYMYKLNEPENPNTWEVTSLIQIYKGFIAGYKNGKIQVYHH